MSNSKPKGYFDESGGYHDEVGGYHEGGCGNDPNGKFCGECARLSCADCPVWKKGGNDK